MTDIRAAADQQRLLLDEFRRTAIGDGTNLAAVPVGGEREPD